MKAQLIYDLAHQTAWISGEKMQEYLKRLTGEFSPSGRAEIDHYVLKDLVDEDKELAGLLMGLATFGKDDAVRAFLEHEMNWSLGWD